MKAEMEGVGGRMGRVVTPMGAAQRRRETTRDPREVADAGIGEIPFFAVAVVIGKRRRYDRGTCPLRMS
jgi:hypothetical protein